MADTTNTPARPETSTPPKPRSQIGGGFIVLRRRGSKGALKCANSPFEHRTMESAVAEAEKLSEDLGGEFTVWVQATSFRTAEKPYQPPVPTEAPAAPPPPKVAETGRKILTAKSLQAGMPSIQKPAAKIPAKAPRKPAGRA